MSHSPRRPLADQCGSDRGTASRPRDFLLVFAYLRNMLADTKSAINIGNHRGDGNVMRFDRCGMDGALCSSDHDGGLVMCEN